ncbi:MAG: hypothetical protein RBU37_24425 [Myxococcota bacterium]|nr:hypothetical protein [Myxococcota bacterium]
MPRLRPPRVGAVEGNRPSAQSTRSWGGQAKRPIDQEHGKQAKRPINKKCPIDQEGQVIDALCILP